MRPIIEVHDLSKTYASGTSALSGVRLDIREGEILALLGPNGAGKTTFISILCGLVTPGGGHVLVDGHDLVRDYRHARALIGLVPQEIAVEPFETVMNTLRFSRGLFGKAPDDAHLEKVLKSLTLWDKRDAKLNELSGGMKRRVLIGKALSHGPRILFLDEPTAGVDVNLRREMWEVVRNLRADGVTIILTTHYLEEAEEMADRIGIIDKGRLLLVQDTAKLMHEFGRKRLTVELAEPLTALPEALADHGLTLSADGTHVSYDYDTRADRSGIARLLAGFAAAGIGVRDLETEQSSLEEVFLRLVEDIGMNWRALRTIFQHEMARFYRTPWESLASPVVSTVLYFVVFGAAIGGRIQSVEGVSYGAFIVPGLIMLTVLQQSISNASFGIFFPKFVGTMYEILSAPVSFIEVVMGYVGAAALKSVIIAVVIYFTALFFVDIPLVHPIWALGFLILTAFGFSLFGFLLGIWAKDWQQLQFIPLMVITPLVFLGGAFYSASMLPPFWQGVAHLNPVLYLISGFRWAFFGMADVPVAASLAALALFLLAGIVAVWAIFRTGWRLRP